MVFDQNYYNLLFFRTTWDEDDYNMSSYKSSTWDMPTPKSSIDDDPTRTPRFTPAYKYNKWDSNRASGATPKPGKGIIQMIQYSYKNGK